MRSITPGGYRPLFPRSQARSVARSCFEKLGVNFLETLLFPFVPKEEYDKRFRLEKRGNVDAVLQANQGVLALGFHYSNWEITGVASFLLKRDIVALARPLKGHAALNGFLNRLRASTGLTIIPNKETARDVVRLLRENHMVAFLGDQREKRSKAVWVELLRAKGAHLERRRRHSDEDRGAYCPHLCEKRRLPPVYGGL